MKATSHAKVQALRDVVLELIGLVASLQQRVESLETKEYAIYLSHQTTARQASNDVIRDLRQRLDELDEIEDVA